MVAGIEKRNILVVDDERQITRVLKTALSSRGYSIRTATDGDEALHIMQDWSPDIVITDLRMPNMDGLELCKTIRAKSQIPIIVLSVKGEDQIKVEALDAGADDYVTKPFSMDELLARTRAALRRASAAKDSAPDLIAIGDFRIDLQARSVCVKEREVRLTPKEFDLLLYLARHPGKVMTHRALLSAVWGENSVEQPAYLRLFIGYFFVALCKDCRNCHVVGYLLKIENVGDWEHKDANERIHTPVEMRFEARSSCRVRHVFLKSTKGSCAD